MDQEMVKIVEKGDISKLLCLLNCGIKLSEMRDGSGSNLLHVAVLGRQMDSIAWIVEYLPELCTEKNIVGRTPLHCACKPIFGLDIIMKLLATNKESLYIVDDDAQRTPLHYVAADCEGLDITEYLINCGANINAVDKKGMSVLRTAIKAANYETVKLLLKKGAIVDPVDCLLVDILHWPILQALLQYKPSAVNCANADGYTLLMRVAKFGDSTKIKELLERGADVSLQSSRGTTALMEAVRSGYIDGVKLLLQNGADPTVQDKEGNNVLNLTCECDFNAKELLTLFYNHEAFKNNLFQIASEHMHPLGVVLRKKRSVELLKFIVSSEVFCDRDLVFHEDFFNVDMLKKFDSSNMALGAISYLLHNPESNLITDDTTMALLHILLEANFPLNSYNGSVPPLTILLSCSSVDVANERRFTYICDILIQHGADVHNMGLSIVAEEMTDIALLREETFLPDALLMACCCNHIQAIRRLKKYWAAPPLALLLLVPSVDFTASMYHFLAAHGLPPGTNLYIQLRNRLHHLQKTHSRWQTSPFPSICSHFADITSKPPTLLFLAKFAVRTQFAHTAVQPGSETLPQQLQNVWPPSLREAILLEDQLAEPTIQPIAELLH